MTVTSQNRDRGICSGCGRDYEITKRGRVRLHSRVVVSVGLVQRLGCPGAGLPPVAEEQP